MSIPRTLIMSWILLLALTAPALPAVACNTSRSDLPGQSTVTVLPTRPSVETPRQKTSAVEPTVPPTLTPPAQTAVMVKQPQTNPTVQRGRFPSHPDHLQPRWDSHRLQCVQRPLPRGRAKRLFSDAVPSAYGHATERPPFQRVFANSAADDDLIVGGSLLSMVLRAHSLDEGANGYAYTRRL